MFNNLVAITIETNYNVADENVLFSLNGRTVEYEFEIHAFNCFKMASNSFSLVCCFQTIKAG